MLKKTISLNGQQEGHIFLMGIKEWIPREAKRQGRPKTRGRDLVEDKCGASWMLKPQDKSYLEEFME